MNPPASANKSLKGVWICVFLLASIIWTVHIQRPVDLPAWHEFDYSSIARNFVLEGNNILYPRIDWRGDGPGFTEMEFPIVPWTMAQLYRAFGVHEITGRILSCAFMLLSLWVFRRLALEVLPEPAAIAAALFFVVSHEVVEVATAIQPESLMLLFYLLAVYYFVDWYEHNKWLSYTLAVAAFACAMLVKSPAAHLAIFFLLWALQKDGIKALRRPSLYFFALLSFAPVVIWYAHAAGLWHQFHNSMGVSNEDHWIGLDMLKRPKVIANLLSIDIVLVFGGGGLLVAFAALQRDRFRSVANCLALSWCIAIGIYLVVIIRTAGAYWAAYYHVIAVAPIALLFGVGVSYLQQSVSLSWPRLLSWSGLSLAILLIAFMIGERRGLSHLPGVFQDLLSAHSSLAILLVLAVLSLLLMVLCLRLAESLKPPRMTTVAPLTATIICIGCATYFFVSGQLLLGAWKGFDTRTPQFVCSMALKSRLSQEGLIVASGGVCSDAAGHRVANDAPNMFYWLDRKGFTTCQGHESITELKGFSSRGARYYVADKASLEEQPGFDTQLRSAFPLLAECDAAELFDLRPDTR